MSDVARDCRKGKLSWEMFITSFAHIRKEGVGVQAFS